MQYDMHFYGTYAMAAAAGIPRNDAETIATAAQFVDDQNETSWVKAKSGEGVLGIATAHHPLDAGLRSVMKDTSEDDTRLVWVPFHFLPGVRGETFAERSTCQKDSAVANAMLDYYLSPSTIEAHRDHALHLIGVAAHVYADTFAHYGFSGMSHEINQISPGTLSIDRSHTAGIIGYLESQKEAFQARFGEGLKLGHGAVFTYPDRPYLKWSFDYRDGRSVKRSNPDTFLEACEALYRRFRQFSDVYYAKRVEPVIGWDAIKNEVARIIQTEGKAEERAQYWIDAIKTRKLGKVQPCKTYDPEEWAQQMRGVKQSTDAREFSASDPYKFFAAAEYHRSFVLKRLLPKFHLLMA